MLIDHEKTKAIDLVLQNRTSIPVQPPQGKPAALRYLPYPFHNYFTITSDCDGPCIPRWKHVGETIREKLALPISDSIFINWLVRRGEANRGNKRERNSRKTPVFDRKRFIEKNAFMLRRFHRGWFDVIHGWLRRFMIKIADDFHLRCGSRRNYALQLLITRLFGKTPRYTLPSRKHRVVFVAPPGWQQFEAPRYLYFRYVLPIEGSYFNIIGYVDSKEVFSIDSRQFDPHHRFVALPETIDLYPLMGKDPDKLLNLKVDFELVSAGASEATLSVEQPMLLSDIREDVLYHFNLMREFNLCLSTFTTHGIAMAIGVRHMPTSESVDERFLSDYPGNDHYFLDIVRAAGLDFINTFNNIVGTDIVHISDQIKPVVLNDGSISYDFPRFMCVPKDSKGRSDYSPFMIDGEETNLSHSDYIGFHTREALDRMSEPGQGALLYTHAGFRNPQIMSHQWRQSGIEPDKYESINQDSIDALKDVADRYYNLSGNVPDTRRLWVAPTSVLLRFSQVMRHAPDNVTYDESGNSVFITTWFDPVTKYPVPNPLKGLKDLRWLTIYVRDSETARVFVDNREITHFIRNPADNTDMQSVTIADVSSPMVIFDEVDLDRKGKVLCRSCTCAGIEHESFRGQRSLKIESGKGKGTATYYPGVPIDLRNHQLVRFAYRKLTPDTTMRVTFNLNTGVQWSICDHDDASSTHAWRISRHKDCEWHDVIVPYWSLMSAVPPDCRDVPATEIQAVLFDIQGSLLIDCLELLRDNDSPASFDDCLLVGGKVTPADQAGMVRMILDGTTYETEPTKSGYYIFEKKAPRGSIADIHAVGKDSRLHAPLSGALREIYCDCLDIDIEIQ